MELYVHDFSLGPLNNSDSNAATAYVSYTTHTGLPTEPPFKGRDP